MMTTAATLSEQSRAEQSRAEQSRAEQSSLLNRFKVLKTRIFSSPDDGKGTQSFLSVLRSFGDFFVKPFAVLCVIYTVALSALIRANFNYIDDLDRTLGGGRGWRNFHRYISEYFSIFIHADVRLADISPLTQLIAVAFISIASCVLLYKFFDKKKISLWGLIAVTPLGLTPYFLECLSYKFDSPYMALSVVGSILPLLFIDCTMPVYFCAGFIGTLIMWLSYQAQSGAFLLCVVFYLAKEWNDGVDFVDGGLLKKFFVSLGSYTVASLAFSSATVGHTKGYWSTDIQPINRILPGAIKAIRKYCSCLKSDSPRQWIILFLFLCLCFVYAFVRSSRRQKYKSCLLALALFPVGIIGSYGTYALLQKPPFMPRAVSGFAVFVALLCVITVGMFKKRILLKIACLGLPWCFFVFAFIYGNALAEEEKFMHFRAQEAVTDFVRVIELNPKKKYKVQVISDMSHCPIVQRLEKRYPVLGKLVPRMIKTGWYRSFHYLRGYFALPYVSLVFLREPKDDFRKLNLPVRFENCYHVISANEDHALIYFKK